MALDVRVRTRSHLTTLLQLFDEQCLAQFNGQKLSKQQRTVARAALLSLRDSVHSKIAKYVTIQDEIPKSQLLMQRIDVELQQAVADLESQSIQLQEQLEQTRSEAIERYEKALGAALSRSIQIDDDDSTGLGLPSCTQQQCGLPTDSDINRIKRVLRESDHVVKRIDKNVTLAMTSLSDLSKVCQEKVTAGASKVKSREFENAFNENSIPADAFPDHEPFSKRQRYGPRFTKRFN